MHQYLLKTFILLCLILIVLAMGCVGDSPMSQLSLKGKKALMVVAPQDFRDEEYFDTKRVLENSGVTVITASRNVREASGMLGGKARVDVNLSDVDAEGFDAVVFVGGGGAQVYFNDSRAQQIAVSAYEKGKIVAAICLAPVILANAGILQGKRATCFDGVYASQLEAGGAEYTGEEVTRDENIITANGPAAAKDFGSEIARAMAGK